MNVRHSMLTLACFGLLATGAFAMSPNESANSQGNTHMDKQSTSSSDARTQPPFGFGGDGQSEADSQSKGHNTTMGSDSNTAMGTDSKSQDTESISGEILRVQGDLYVVKDEMGKEVKLHVDHSTQKSGELKKGDKIEAEISTKRHAVSVKKSGAQDAAKADDKE